ncbi:hypothetical protein AB4142_29930, partial [Variovorax sp. 2RAF20]
MRPRPAPVACLLGACLLLGAALHAQDAPAVAGAADKNQPLSPTAPVAQAKDTQGSWWSRFRDPQDSSVDMSRWLLQHKGALLVP